MKYRDLPPGQEDYPINPFPGGVEWKDLWVTEHVPVDQPEAYEREIQQALHEADEGDFATEEEMQALDDKWAKRSARDPQKTGHQRATPGESIVDAIRRELPDAEANYEKNLAALERRREELRKTLIEEQDVLHMDVPGLPEVIARLEEKGFSDVNQAYWLVSPNLRLNGATPLDLLRKGELDEVLWATVSGIDV